MNRLATINQLLRRVNQLLLLTILLFGIYFIASLVILIHQSPAKYLSFVVHQTAVQAGQTVTYDFSFCRNVGPEVTTNVVQNLSPVDAAGKLLKGATPVTLVNNPNVGADKGCSVAKDRMLTIPQATPAGCYRVHRVGQYYKLVGFKPSSVDIYSNVVCVSAFRQPDIQTQLNDLREQLDRLSASASQASAGPTSSTDASGASTPGTIALAPAAQSPGTPSAPAVDPQPQRLGLVQGALNGITSLISGLL
jgi:hypothetical protein